MRTPEHNGIAERRNISIIKVARAMLAKNDVSKMFWREVVNTIVYTMNVVQFRKDTNYCNVEPNQIQRFIQHDFLPILFL